MVRRGPAGSWSGGGRGGRSGRRRDGLGRRRRGGLVLRDELVPARVANRADVDRAAGGIARLSAMVRGGGVLCHFIPPMGPVHLSLSGSVLRFRSTGPRSPR